MASRLGDVGITEQLDAERGYTLRVGVSDLNLFNDKPDLVGSEMLDKEP